MFKPLAIFLFVTLVGVGGSIAFVLKNDSSPDGDALPGAREPASVLQGASDPSAVATSASASPAPALPSAIVTSQGEAKATQGDLAYARFQTGDYEGAVTLLRKQMEAHPQVEIIRQNLATALYALAVVRMHQRDFADAELLLSESARLGNNDAARALATVKLKQGDVALAGELFEEQFQRTQDARSLQALVDIALAHDDLEKAGAFLDRLAAKQAETPDEGLARYVTQARKRLEEKEKLGAARLSVEKGNIEVDYFRAEHAPLAAHVAGAVESALGELAGLLGPLPGTVRTRVTLVPQETFSGDASIPAWAGALFDGVIRIPVPKGGTGLRSGPLLARLARHETTHAYLFAFCGDTVPSWIGEGLAQRFERRSVQQAVVDLRQRLGTQRALGSVEADIDSRYADAPASRVHVLYSQAFVLSDFLGAERGGDGFWRNVLQLACIERRPISQVLDEHAGAPSAESLWRMHAQRIVERHR